MSIICEDLRRSVLQSAITGKLSVRLDSDTLIGELIKDLKKENQKIKLDCEIELDIPDEWGCYRLGDISTYGGKKSKVTYTTASQNSWLLELEDIEKGGDVIRYTRVKDKKSKGDKTIFKKNDILYSKLRPYLKKILIAKYDGVCTPELVPFSMYGNINHRYIEYFLKSPYVDDNINKLTYGVKMPRVGTQTMLNLLVPVPPIEEQQRIVDKVDELMTKIDELETIENQLNTLKQEFPNKMKEALLQAAIEGKLTKRLYTDSSVDVFLEECKDIKRKLKEKKNLKNKKSPKVIEEYLFDIPESWNWVCLGDIVDFSMGKTPSRHETNYWKDDISWVSIADIGSERQITKTKEKVSYQAISDVFKDKIVPKGTLIMSFKLSIGKVAFLSQDSVHNEAIISIYPFKEKDILNEYLYKVLPYMSAFGDTKGAIKGNTLNSTSLTNLEIPLPPIEEQQRIVDMLDKLLPLCDDLTEERMEALLHA